MKRIALVNQRYGLEVNGGSEYYTRLIAERLCKHFKVDVITTKALDYTTWNDHYSSDEEDINGVHVRRFSVKNCRAKDFNEYNGQYLLELSTGKGNIEKENIWFEKQGPFCPDAIDFICDNKENYDVFIFVTYLYYLTVKGLPEVADKAIFIPTAHEEPYIHFNSFRELFLKPSAYIFLTEEEKSLVQNLFDCEKIPYEVMGTGVDIPCVPDETSFRKKYNLNNDYIIYVGRIDEGKDCPMMFRYFSEYKKRNPKNNLKLVLMGKQICDIPENSDIINLGFVSEEDKFSGISGAKCLVLPSRFESLSISVLEAMSLSVPVIVNGACEVLKGHCIKSNGGLYYNNYFEFEGALNYMLIHQNEYEMMKENALCYIDKYYKWDIIIRNFKNIIDTVCDKYKE